MHGLGPIEHAIALALLRGFGQMIVCNNRSTGLCVLIGLFLLSPQAALLALLEEPSP